MATVDERIAATKQAIMDGAKDRGWEAVDTNWRLNINGAEVRVRETRTSDKWHSKPTGKLAVTVFGVDRLWPLLGQAILTKTFPEGNAGVTIGKVLNHVGLVIAHRESQKAVETAKVQALADAAEAQVLMQRKAAALDRLDAYLQQTGDELSVAYDAQARLAEKGGGYPQLHGPDLLTLAEALPEPEEAQTDEAT